MIGLPSIILPRGAKGCMMQWAAILADPQLLGQPWDVVTDHPSCTNEVVTTAAIRVNDLTNDETRQGLWLLLPRINEARRTSADRRVNRRLAIWCAKSVLHLVTDPTDRKASERWIWLAEKALGERLNDEERQEASSAASAADDAAAHASSAAADDAASSAAAYASAARAYAASSAASAADAASAHASYAASSAASASAASSAAAASYAASDPIGWLGRLLDAHEKACADEGVLHELEEAMCFIGSQWGGS